MSGYGLPAPQMQMRAMNNGPLQASQPTHLLCHCGAAAVPIEQQSAKPHADINSDDVSHTASPQADLATIL